MQRVIDQLNMTKSDLKHIITNLMYENKIKKEIIEECEDEFEVGLLKEDIDENNLSMNDLKETVIEMDQVVEMLVLANDITKK